MCRVCAMRPIPPVLRHRKYLSRLLATGSSSPQASVSAASAPCLAAASPPADTVTATCTGRQRRQDEGGRDEPECQRGRPSPHRPGL